MIGDTFYEVWMEGFAATSEHGKASFVGTARAQTFRDACEQALRKGKYSMSCYNAERNTYWGCSMFDNEADARKSFG